MTGLLIISSIMATAQIDTNLVKDNPVELTSSPTEPQKSQKTPNQKKDVMPFIKKFYLGGTFGASFGDYTSITIAPTIGYSIKPSLQTGLKLYYTYSKQTISILTQNNEYEHHTYGFGTFLRWYPLKDLYLHVAPELINYQINESDNTGSVVEAKEWVPFFWAGAGYRKMIGKRTWVSTHVLFDLLQDKNSPFKQWEPNIVIGGGASF
jgi:hypothetical protein